MLRLDVNFVKYHEPRPLRPEFRVRRLSCS